MKQNIKSLIVLVLLSVFSTACQKDFLDEKLYSSFAPESLTDALAFDAALIGLQNKFSEWHTFTGDQGWLACWQVGTDVAYNKAPADLDIWMVPYTNYASLTSTDPAASYAWTWAYQIINNANTIIAGIESSTNTVPDATKKAINGEARFYRALAYNTLATVFGSVPIIKTPITGPKTDFTRSKIAELNQFIIDDLNFAATNLPTIENVKTNSKGKRYSSAHSAMANQLLAEVLLRTGGKDADAEAACNAVINSKDFSLTSARFGVKSGAPGDAFADMFIYGNQRRSQGNKEAIWVLEMENPNTVIGGTGSNSAPGVGTTGIPQQRRVWGSRYHQQAGMLLCDSLGGRGISRLALTNWVLNGIYETKDMRNSPYNLRRDYYYNNPTYARYGQKVNPNEAGVDTNRFIVPQINKWNQYDPNDAFGFAMIKDFIIMRLGETYLLKAEAQFKQGKLAEAAATLNILRARANATPITSTDVTMDFILDERVRELIGEENRRMTLMRTGTLVSRVVGRGQKITGVTANNLLLPIPLSEIQLNKDATLEQNPGY